MNSPEGYGHSNKALLLFKTIFLSKYEYLRDVKLKTNLNASYVFMSPKMHLTF